MANFFDVLPMLLVALGAIVLIVVAIVEGVYQAGQFVFVRRMRARWHAKYREIQFGPVGVWLSSLHHHQKRARGTFGALALADNCLVYKGKNNDVFDVAIPLEAIQCVGLRIAGLFDPATPVHTKLRIEFQSSDGLRVFTFNLWRSRSLETLAAQIGLPIHQLDPWPQELAPTNATRMMQDIYGQWHVDCSDKLYLAPDRLVFAWQDAIMLADIRALALYDKPGALDMLKPFAHSLLRIEYCANVDLPPQTVGFELVDARTWGERIAARSGVSLTIHAGQKKMSA